VTGIFVYGYAAKKSALVALETSLLAKYSHRQDRKNVFELMPEVRGSKVQHFATGNR